MTIYVKHIYKDFDLSSKKKIQVLEDISFTIETGDFVVILGESGCGKSTLLNLIAGLHPLSEGEIRVDNKVIDSPHPSRSILFQQPALLPWLNVEDNIMFGCKLRGEKKHPDEIRQWIENIGLSGFEKTYPAELSLGMAQRVCLARALIGNPEILMLDEPFSALDTFTRTHLQKELTRFWQMKKFTAIFVTHDIDEAILLGSRIILLGGRPGRVIASFEVNMDYPRYMGDPSFFKSRTDILKKLRETLVGFRERIDYVPL